ncbi:putative signal peptide protein [Rhodopirellula islandica]|uniref:Signal peptide protein n=1 Tax=Rhodopirellula islandica TaxID=595434 RepID=A0A0J1BNA6_RHOIS|nr:hypothetical protein [Rhodopirellula islandica]KLU07956.1 putative signal peptide protein [Rhodopirellula islandica]
MTQQFAKWIFACGIIAGVTAWTAGCSPSPSSTDEAASTPQQFVIARGEPRDRLRQIFARYRGSSYYQDTSEVVLRVVPMADASTELFSGGRQEQRAPFRVRWTGKQLDVQAYSVSLRANSTLQSNQVELNAWFDEPETRHFDSQMLVDSWQQPENQRLDLDRVLADEVLRSKLSAGLAGPPPQLEWLFAGDPMSGIFEPTAELKWLPDANFAGQKMRRIAAETEGKSYVFWVDPTVSVIRRVELPLPLIEGLDARQSSLTLEFRRAEFAPPSDEEDSSRFDFQPPFTPQRVSRFVPVPPPPPSSILGRRLPNDAMRTLRSGGTTSEVVLFRLSQDEAVSATEPRWIAAAITQSRQSNLSRVRWVVATEDAGFRRELASAWSGAVTVLDANALDDVFGLLRLRPGSAAVIGSDQTVLLTERQINASTVSNVVAALVDDAAEVDVPEKILADYKQMIRAYETELAQALQQ